MCYLCHVAPASLACHGKHSLRDRSYARFFASGQSQGIKGAVHASQHIAPNRTPHVHINALLTHMIYIYTYASPHIQDMVQGDFDMVCDLLSFRPPPSRYALPSQR